MHEQARYTFWLTTRRCTLGLLGVWLLVTLAVPWFARELDRYSFLGFPLGYWLAAEGALLVYIALIALYVAVMDRLEASLLAQTAAAPGGHATVPEQG